MAQQQMRMATEFRHDDLQAVMGYIHSGKSVEIIGVGSVGKSNFVRRLSMPDVLERYLYKMYGEDSHCVFITLDANSLLEPMPSALDPTQPSGWHGYELMGSRLLQAVMENGLVSHINDSNDPAHPERLYALYHRIWSNENGGKNSHLLAFRYLEDLIQRVFVGTNRRLRLIFIMDEFEKMLAELPPRFFRSLRSLRDQHKDRLLYITTARQIMPLLIHSRLESEYEPFIELFRETRHFLLPYGPADAQQQFNRLSKRQDYAAPPDVLREQLLAVTNGHAGLLRAAFAAWEPERLIYEGLSDAEVISILLTLSSIQEECKTIWNSLSERERRLLYDMVIAMQRHHGLAVDPLQNPVAFLLIEKGLLLETRSMSFSNIRPLVFAAFLLSNLRPDANEMPVFTHAEY